MNMFRSIMMIGLKLWYMAPKLLHGRGGDALRGYPSSLRNLCSHIVSQIIITSARYLASVKERLIVRFSFEYYDKRFEPKKITYAELEP